MKYKNNWINFKFTYILISEGDLSLFLSSIKV